MSTVTETLRVGGHGERVAQAGNPFEAKIIFSSMNKQSGILVPLGNYQINE